MAEPQKYRRWRAPLIAAILAALAAGGAGYWAGTWQHKAVPPAAAPKPAAVEAPPAAAKVATGALTGTLKMAVPVLGGADHRLPLDYTCYRTDLSPPVSWRGTPEGTRSLVLVMVRTDAGPAEAANWVVYNIPVSLTSLPAGMPHTALFQNGMGQARNDHGAAAYTGPCEPRGISRYAFRLYALDAALKLPAATKGTLYAAMAGHVLDMAEVPAIHYLRFVNAGLSPAQTLPHGPPVPAKKR